jgi:hypothetical protein
MFSQINKVILIGALVFPGAGLLFAGAASSISLSILGQRADVVVIAKVISVSSSSAHDLFAQLGPMQFVKGSSTATSLTVQLTASPLIQASDVLSPAQASVGTSGLWFLKGTATSSFVILPVVAGDYPPLDGFYPIGPSILAAVGSLSGTVDHQILALLMASYQSMANPSPSALLKCLYFNPILSSAGLVKPFSYITNPMV